MFERPRERARDAQGSLCSLGGGLVCQLRAATKGCKLSASHDTSLYPHSTKTQLGLFYPKRKPEAEILISCQSIDRLAVTSTQKHGCPSKGTPWALCTQPRTAVWGYFTPVLLKIHTSGPPYFHICTSARPTGVDFSVTYSCISLRCGPMCARTTQVMYALHSAIMDHHIWFVPPV